MLETAAMAMTGEGETAFEDSMRHSEARILRIGYRMLGNWADAEDVAQEAFTRLHRYGMARLSSLDAAEAWVCRVAVNLCLDRIRARSRRPVDELRDVPASSMNAESAVLAEERRRMLAAALAQLPERERAAIVLREVEGLSTAETAAAMGSTEVTVRSQVSKAFARLRGIFGKESGR